MTKRFKAEGCGGISLPGKDGRMAFGTHITEGYTAVIGKYLSVELDSRDITFLLGAILADSMWHGRNPYATAIPRIVRAVEADREEHKNDRMASMPHAQSMRLSEIVRTIIQEEVE